MSADGATLGAGLPEMAEQRAVRIARVLGVSGRRLVESSEGWIVMSARDKRRRPLLRLAPEEAARLIADGNVAPARRGGGYVASPPPPAADFQIRPDSSNSDSNPAAGPWLFKVAGLHRPRTKARGFEALALAAFAGDGPLSMRQASAGQRLIEDAEQAGRDPQLTMNWDAGPVDRQRRSAGSPAGPRGAVAAGRRLQRLQAAFAKSQPGFEFLWAACVQQASLLALRRRFDLGREQTVDTLAAMLEKLAEVYDG